ncbi:MAG TPA: HEAT repeat domain-containing protein [Bacillota bacterium]|nr:HEAT repeat domain-containing protein [Bacillota bacterium]
MKKYFIGWIAIAIAGAAVGRVWMLANQSERTERYLSELAARSAKPDLKQADSFAAQDLPRLMVAMARQDTPFETACLWLCSELPESARGCLPQVYPAAMLRLNAAALAGRWGGAAKAAVPQLVQLLKDDVADSNAALSLGLIGSDAKEAIPALIIAVQEQRPWAATALGKMGPAARTALPTLQAACETGPEWLRRESLLALHRIGENLSAQN